MKVTKIDQKYFLCTFWGFLVTIICDIKIDANMSEPHYVNLYFLWTSSIVQVFDFLTFDIFLTTWHLFDILLSHHLCAPLPMGKVILSYLLKLWNLSWSCKNLRLPHIFLISGVNSCLILMYDCSFQSLEPSLQEYEVLWPLEGLKGTQKW